MTSLDRAIAALLDEPHNGLSERRELVQHVLTSGYAEILDLEADRIRLERRLRSDRDDLHAVSDALHAVEARVQNLRALLDELDARLCGQQRGAGVTATPGRA